MNPLLVGALAGLAYVAMSAFVLGFVQFAQSSEGNRRVTWSMRVSLLFVSAVSPLGGAFVHLYDVRWVFGMIIGSFIWGLGIFLCTTHIWRDLDHVYPHWLRDEAVK